MTRPETCSRCGQEVRWGWRPTKREPVQLSPTRGFWMHQDPEVDHVPVLGQALTPEILAEIECQMDLPRTKLDKDGEEVVYTTRTWKSAKPKKVSESEVDGGEVVEDWDGVIAEPEIRADLSVVPWPLRDWVPAGAWLVLKPALAAGLEVFRASYAKGIWLRADTQRPGTSETWVVGVRAPWLDSDTTAAVGCWRSTGTGWGFAHGLLVTDRVGRFCQANDIKQWIKTIQEAQRGS